MPLPRRLFSNMLYNTLKILHILSAALVVTSIIYCCHLWLKQKPSHTIQIQTWRTIIPFALFQLATGFTMISLKQYNLSEFWIIGSILGFVVVICSWFGFLYCVIASQQSTYLILKWAPPLLLVICCGALLSIIFLMASTLS